MKIAFPAAKASERGLRQLIFKCQGEATAHWQGKPWAGLDPAHPSCPLPDAGGVLYLELGWIPHEIVFTARGEAPFALAFGDVRSRPEALPVASVVPGYRKDEELAAARATIGEATPVRPAKGFLADPGGWIRAAFDSGDARTWLLWLVLGGGVLAVAWMALRLLRELGGKPPQTPGG
jgi:hypothetical protein